MIEEMRGNVMDLQGDGWKVLAGSCLDRLPELADESVDAVVCDPPYELGFMGKSWDSSGIAYDVNVWKECLRVLRMLVLSCVIRLHGFMAVGFLSR